MELTSLEGVNQCTQLKIIHCYTNQLSSLLPLQHCIQLKEVLATGNLLGPFAGLDILKWEIRDNAARKIQRCWSYYWEEELVEVEGVKVNRLCLLDSAKYL